MIATNFPENSKVWVYFSKKALSESEKTSIKEALNAFIAQWQYHGAGVEGQFEIIDDQFLVLIANEQTNVGGCSIDSSVNVFREIDTQLELGLLDRTAVAYANNGQLEHAGFNQIKGLIADGKIQKDTIIFNNSVATLGDFNNNWKQSAENSWVSRFF